MLTLFPRDEFLESLRNENGDVSQKGLLGLRNKLDRAIKEHFATYAELVPGILDIDRIRVVPVGQQELHLPHSLTPEERQLLGVHELAELEVQLRIGQCHDWVSKLREALGLKGMLAESKRPQRKGQKTLTRSIGQTKRANALVKRAARLYRLNWEAVTANKSEEEVSFLMGSLRVLRDSDLRTLHSLVESGRFNSGNLQVSWIWGISPSLDLGGGDVETAIDTWAKEGKPRKISAPAFTDFLRHSHSLGVASYQGGS